MSELHEEMDNCSTAFVFVALAGIALSLAASHGMEVDDAPEVRGPQHSGFRVGVVRRRAPWDGGGRLAPGAEAKGAGFRAWGLRQRAKRDGGGDQSEL